MSSTQAKVFFIVGPTASGKSDAAVAVAEQTGAEIINCDSVQFFAGVEIGAAKPEPELLQRARHHLIGTVPIGADYNAGDFRRDALRVIAESGAGRFVAVGGSGFYVQALEKGMYDVPEIAVGVREALEAEACAGPEGLTKLHQELHARDPLSAAKIDPNDRYRILRSLEVLRSHPSETLSEIRERFRAQEPPRIFESAKAGLSCERPLLRERITLRTKRMLADGLIDEVRELRGRIRAMGLEDWAPLRSVGYSEVQDFLSGLRSREDLEAAIVTSTMQLAKRQMTWFKRDPATAWFDIGKGADIATEGLLARAQKFFAGKVT